MQKNQLESMRIIKVVLDLQVELKKDLKEFFLSFEPILHLKYIIDLEIKLLNNNKQN